MAALDVLKRVQNLAIADATGNDPKTHWDLIDEIHKLRMAVETPAEKTLRMRFESLQNMCVRMAIEYGIIQAIADKKGENVTAAELSKKLGIEESLIIRIMRLVTFPDFCTETGHGEYASNETTELMTHPGFVGGQKHFTDLLLPVEGNMTDYIRKHGVHQFPENDGEMNPFEYTYGDPIFDYFENHQEPKVAFDNYMSVRRDPNALQWFENYPAHEQLRPEDLKQDKDALLLVDVGGGIGHEISKFHQRFPDLPGRLILEDLPKTIDKMEKAPEGIEVVKHDFFTEQPVKGARMYYMRSIMHDWSDPKCKTILSHLAAAMDKDYSRVLIDDFTLPNMDVDVRAASMDVLMMLLTSGIERSVKQWESLLDSAGLEIVKIWYARAGCESVVEAKLKSECGPNGAT